MAEMIESAGGISELAKLITNYGVGVICLAVLLALHVYNVRVTMPTLTKTAQDQVLLLVDKFQLQLEKMTAQFHNELLQERELRTKDTVNLLKGFNDLAKSIGDNQTALVRLIDRFDKHT